MTCNHDSVDSLEESIINEPNNYPVDHKALDVMRTSMGAIFNELLATYMEQSRAFLAELEKAYEARDSQVIERVFHSMGSSSLNVGATKLSELARFLERQATDDPDEITLEQIENLKQEYLAVEEVLQTILSSEP